MSTTKEQIIKAIKSFRYGGKQFTEVLPEVLKGMLDLIGEASNVAFTVSDITALTDEQLNALKPGDAVVKEDALGSETTYYVTGKAEGSGLWLTAFGGTTIETLFYEDMGGTWSFQETQYPGYHIFPVNGEIDEGEMLTALSVLSKGGQVYVNGNDTAAACCLVTCWSDAASTLSYFDSTGTFSSITVAEPEPEEDDSEE